MMIAALGYTCFGVIIGYSIAMLTHKLYWRGSPTFETVIRDLVSEHRDEPSP